MARNQRDEPIKAAIVSVTDTADSTYSSNEETMLGNLKSKMNNIILALEGAQIIQS